MELSLIKILDATLEKAERQIFIEAEILKGNLQKGDGVFIRIGQFGFAVQFTEIVNISSYSNNRFKLELTYDENDFFYWGDLTNYLKEDNIAFCGMSLKDYLNISIDEKVEYLKSLLDFVGKGQVPHIIKSLMKPACKLILKDRESNDVSKFGGLPLAPASFQFPKDSYGNYQLFIGQLFIREFNKFFKTTKEFKSDGIIYFFGSIEKEEYDGFKDNLTAIYSEETENLQIIPLPEELENYGVFAERDLIVSEEVHIPTYETSFFDYRKLTREELDSYHYIEAILANYNYLEGSELLGIPNQIQGCVFLETEMKKEKLDFKTMDENLAQKNALAWRQLLGIDLSDEYFKELSNFDGVFNEYSDGRMYLMIKEEDFKNMDFSNSETVGQYT
jgi:uncharacterized protein YwqG